MNKYLNPDLYFLNNMGITFMPKISVLMPAFNSEKYIKEAIESILSQTFHDFELIIINDGSTDSTEKIILSYKDTRINYLKNETNLGLISTLNKGINICQGEYIARMDADDISHTDRFNRQVHFLDENPDIGLCGTWIYLFRNKNIEIKEEIKNTTNQDEIVEDMLLYNQIGHPTVMFRKSILENGRFNYNSSYKHAEDYKLWTDIIQVTKIANLPEFLLYYRIHNENISIKYIQEQIDISNKIKKEYLESLIGHIVTQVDFDVLFDNKPTKLRSQTITLIDELVDYCNIKNPHGTRFHSFLIQEFTNILVHVSFLKIPMNTYFSKLFRSLPLNKKVYLLIKNVYNTVSVLIKGKKL